VGRTGQDEPLYIWLKQYGRTDDDRKLQILEDEYGASGVYRHRPYKNQSTGEVKEANSVHITSFQLIGTSDEQVLPGIETRQTLFISNNSNSSNSSHRNSANTSNPNPTNNPEASLL
jgi:hypothetical protein